MHPQHNTLALVNAAADRARAAGQRWTPQRSTVYAALLASKNAVGAYDLIDMLARRQGLQLKPASLYRTLDDLQDLGLVVKIESLNAWRACHHPHQDHQHVFLVCGGCGSTDEIADHGAARHLSHSAAALGFKTSRQVLELHGNCRSCTDQE
jgi:Fur family zinc uptake transcriptional regulator